jgi:hypothetical protein
MTRPGPCGLAVLFLGDPTRSLHFVIPALAEIQQYKHWIPR